MGRVVRRALILAGTGVMAGLVAAVLLTRWLESRFYEVDLLSPITFGGAAVVLLAVAAGSSYVPALRAAHVEPRTALGGE
ncbi:MAG: hypothetical protein ACLF0P_09590 [Thermoanaerobaculia bacterium]